MADSSDKSTIQGPKPGPQEKVFLTYIMNRLFCTPGTSTMQYPTELEDDAGRRGTSDKQPRSGRFPPTCKFTVQAIERKTKLPIADEYIKSKPQLLRFIENPLRRMVGSDLEYQVINGDGNEAYKNIRGLFFRPTEPPKELDGYCDPYYKLICERTDEDLVEFYLKALAKYRRPYPDGAGREPTHLILPVSGWEQLLSQKKQNDAHLLASDLDKLWNLKILASDFVPDGRGLLLDISEIALVLAGGLDWELGEWSGILKGYSAITGTHKANLLIKYPRSIMILDGLGITEETERSQEVPELSEEPVVKSTLWHIEEKLDLRTLLLNRNRKILRDSGVDSKGKLDLSGAHGNNASKVQDRLQSRYDEIGSIDCLIENVGNKEKSAFIIDEYKKDRDTYEDNRRRDWSEKFRHRGFIFRGQSSKWPVTSSLYRSLLRIGKGACLHSVEKKILTAAGYISLPHTPKSEIFADLQHFGGMTNYIDFTTDFTTALYFACKDNLENDGEVFIVRPNDFPIIYPIGQDPERDDDSTCEYTAVVMAVNHLNIRRAEAQKNVFIRPDNGFIDSNKFIRAEDLSEGKTEDFMVLTIKAEEKRSIMGYLRRYGIIEKLTFFEDILGIIERDRSFEKRSSTNEDTLLKLEQYDNMEREIRRHRALIQKMSADDNIALPVDSPHYHIGRILYSRGYYKKAVEEFLKAEGCYKLKEIPHHLYLFLASAYVKLKDHTLALEQLTKARRENYDDLYYFIAADERFRAKDYKNAWQNIKNAVRLNKTSMTYLRLKILIANELKDNTEVKECADLYLAYCAYDPEITELKNKLERSKNKRR